VLAFASITTVINALIRLCCFILLIPSWEGKMPIPERRLHPTNASERQISSCNVGAIHRRPSFALLFVAP
jgi:hypothetical protein